MLQTTAMPGLEGLWAQSDAITRTVALLLLTMSLASWCVILAKGLRQWQLQRCAREVGPAFWQASRLQDAIATLTPDTPFAQLALAGQEALAHHREHDHLLQGQLTLSDWLTLSLRQSIDESQARLQAGMSVLASVGSTAPFVGLFGTVWGIYHALMAIGATGQATLDKVAGPVGESLIMTAFGLAVAIPATFGYNALVRGNKALTARLNKFGFDLHALLLTGRRGGPPVQAVHTVAESANAAQLGLVGSR